MTCNLKLHRRYKKRLAVNSRQNHTNRLLRMEHLENRCLLSGVPLPNDPSTLMLLRLDGNLIGVSGETPTASAGNLTVVSGLVNNAIQFGDPGYVQYDNGNISGLQGTVEFWIRPDWNAVDENDAHTFFNVGGAFNNSMLLSIDTARNLRFIQWGDDPTTEINESNVERGIATNVSSWNSGQWRHLAATWNGLTGQYAFYVDGELVQSQTNGVRIDAFSAAPLSIGADSNGQVSAEAAFDEVRISSRVRSSYEIRASYNAGFGIPTAALYPPEGQAAVALNHQVQLSWDPIGDPDGAFNHYAIYRSSTPFTEIGAMTPLATVNMVSSNSYVDASAENGIAYYYAVTTVDNMGTRYSQLQSLPARRPRDETDLQVVTVTRSPEFPRYDAQYTFREITEPGGFGPYYFSAATGLGSGQTLVDPRFPSIGQPVTYTATVRNRGTNTISGSLSAVWKLDGVTLASPSQVVHLLPGQSTTFSRNIPWDDQFHDITFQLLTGDSRSANNVLTIDPFAAPFLNYIERSYAENWRDEFTTDPASQNDDVLDWLNHQMARFNEMFAQAGVKKRLHYGVLQILDDGAATPNIDHSPYAQFPGADYNYRYSASHENIRTSGAYYPEQDVNYSLLHEWGHQLGLIDLYNLNLDPPNNLLTGEPYRTVSELMHGADAFLSDFSELAMKQWERYVHGYFGQYLYDLPATTRLKFHGYDGMPLGGAGIKVYQYVNRPGLGPRLTDQIKFQGVTDANGVFVLPNVDLDPSLTPAVGTGEVLNDNPFGYVDVGGSNGTFYIRVEYDGATEYVWLDIAEVNVAFWKGHTNVATFDRHLGLGGGAGDYDRNGTVNQGDHSTWRSEFGMTIVPAGSSADGNANGIVDAADYVMWRKNLDSGTPPSTGSETGRVGAVEVYNTTSAELFAASDILESKDSASEASTIAPFTRVEILHGNKMNASTRVDARLSAQHFTPAGKLALSLLTVHVTDLDFARWYGQSLVDRVGGLLDERQRGDDLTFIDETLTETTRCDELSRDMAFAFL